LLQSCARFYHTHPRRAHNRATISCRTVFYCTGRSPHQLSLTSAAAARDDLLCLQTARDDLPHQPRDILRIIRPVWIIDDAAARVGRDAVLVHHSS